MPHQEIQEAFSASLLLDQNDDARSESTKLSRDERSYYDIHLEQVTDDELEKRP